MSVEHEQNHPVLIIGAGLAGLTVALHLADHQPVILMAKRRLNEAATAWAQGGIVGVLDQDDSIDSHVSDTVTAGAGLVLSLFLAMLLRTVRTRYIGWWIRVCRLHPMFLVPKDCT